MTRPVALKVGALARQTGISVRTLRYYDEIGLLSPSGRTESGHRLYDIGNIARLHRIKSLQQFGFSLDEIDACLRDRRFVPQQLITLQIRHIERQITLLSDLRQRLEGVSRWLASAGEASVDEFLAILEVMSKMEKHYTQEQLDYLKARREQVGEERIREVEAEWPALIAQVKAEMAAGTDPASPKVQELARRWQALIDEFTGGDAGITQALNAMYQQEPSVRQQAGVDNDLAAYIRRAERAAKSDA